MLWQRHSALGSRGRLRSLGILHALAHLGTVRIVADLVLLSSRFRNNRRPREPALLAYSKSGAWKLSGGNPCRILARLAQYIAAPPHGLDIVLAAPCAATLATPLPGPVDGSGYKGPDPPTAPPVDEPRQP
jgi:hypothetical protein